MAEKELTPAEKEAERKRREEAWWQKVILYYLVQMYHEQVERELEKYRQDPLPVIFSGMVTYIREKHVLDKLREKQAGRLSGLELLQHMDKYQEEDSPFRALNKDLKEHPEDQEKLEKDLARVVEEGPKRILNRGRRNAVHVKNPNKAREPQPQPRPDPEEEERTRYEMAFLRTVMPPEMYRQLCAEMVKQGRMKDPEEFLYVPEQERNGPTYAEYAARHTADPAEKDGALENLDEIYTAAAYQLAAYEQKDSADFDEKKADVRAMELSGSKAFRVYVNSHPGALLGAARGTGLEVTHRQFTALEKKLRTRDETLTAVRDALKARSTDRTAAYHRMVNALDRFVSAPEEPPQRGKEELSLQLAQFVMTEGNPNNHGYHWETAMLASKALKAVLPGKDFNAFLMQANLSRPGEDKLSARELDAFAIPKPQAAPEGPALERNVP